MLPELVRMLPVGDDCGAGLGVTTTVALCHILNSLSLSERQHAQAIVNEGALPRIVDLGRCGGRSVGRRVALLVYHNERLKKKKEKSNPAFLLVEMDQAEWVRQRVTC